MPSCRTFHARAEWLKYDSAPFSGVPFWRRYAASALKPRKSFLCARRRLAWTPSPVDAAIARFRHSQRSSATKQAGRHPPGAGKTGTRRHRFASRPHGAFRTRPRQVKWKPLKRAACAIPLWGGFRQEPRNRQGPRQAPCGRVRTTRSRGCSGTSPSTTHP